MEEKKLDIDINEEVASGVYSNLAVITHSNAEFIIDFASVMPGLPKAVVRSRIVMNPLNAKRLLSALKDNIARFEENNGVITEGGRTDIPILKGGGGLA